MPPVTDRCYRARTDFEPPAYIDLLKLSPADMRALARMTDGDPPHGVIERRRRTRVPLTGRAHADFVGVTGVTSRFVVYMLDLATHEAGFLHSAFIHHGTSCRIRLVLPDGESMAIEGRVRRCSLVRGRAHEVGIEFQHPIPQEVVDRLASSIYRAAASRPSAAGAHASNSPHPSSSPRDAAIRVEVVGILRQLSQALDAASGLGGAIKEICRRLEPPR